MKYKDMSDFEVNKAVAIAIGMRVKVDFDGEFGFTELYHSKYPNTIWAAKCDENGNQIEAWEQKIFTEDPSDIMPIAIEYKIGVEFIDGYGWTASSSYVGDDLVFSCYDNPYRAIAICFLMMKDAEK